MLDACSQFLRDISRTTLGGFFPLLVLWTSCALGQADLSGVARPLDVATMAQAHADFAADCAEALHNQDEPGWRDKERERAAFNRYCGVFGYRVPLSPETKVFNEKHSIELLAKLGERFENVPSYPRTYAQGSRVPPSFQGAESLIRDTRPTAAANITAATRAALLEHLRARLAVGDFGEAPCAPVVNLFPAAQGFDGIRFEAIPGAHRVLVLKSASGWRMVQGVPQLLVLTAAGFYTMQEASYTGPDGVSRPAREFRLTPKGFLAMARPGTHCFDFVSFRSVELTSVETIVTPERLAGLGQALRAKFSIHFSPLEEWARTPEFDYVFNRMMTVGRSTAGPLTKAETVFFSDGRWQGEREAMMAFAIDAAALRPEHRVQADVARQRLIAASVERRAARRANVTASIVKSWLATGPIREQVAPCLELPVRQADRARGFWKKEEAQSLVFYEDLGRRDTARYEEGLESARRLERAGLLKREPFDDEAVPGGRKGKGLRFTLSASAGALLKERRPDCLPLGEAKIETLQLGSAGPQGVTFRGWARLEHPRSWTATLAREFPGVQVVLKQGFGVSGTVGLSEDQPFQARAHVPSFALKSKARPVPLPEIVAKGSPAVVATEPGAPVRMIAQRCAVSRDGTEVSGDCSQARASRGFRAGKVYAEISFQGKGKTAQPSTWTNAAVTTQKSLYSLSNGAAPFSFAGSFTKQLIKDGDLISMALDMDERVLYWRLNGKWMTGRPESGLGEPLPYPGEEYFIAVSAQDKAEMWRINFGGSSFRFPPPHGYAAYGERP
jgi:hypothetical protein